MPEGQVYVATETFFVNVDGADIMIEKDKTRVREGHEILRAAPQNFKPVDAHYEVEAATAAPGERRAR